MMLGTDSSNTFSGHEVLNEEAQSTIQSDKDGVMRGEEIEESMRRKYEDMRAAKLAELKEDGNKYEEGAAHLDFQDFFSAAIRCSAGRSD